MSLAFVFPGQGSQSVGMLAGLAQSSPLVEQAYAEASAVVGYDLWHLVQNGPETDLNDTARTQPALLTAGIACWRVWQANDGAQPAWLAGHSLGEYTALVCADALDFTDAVKLVEQRGQFMQSAVPAGQGAMAAILGLDDEQVAAACTEAREAGHVAPANFNAPGQVVIAGEQAAVERAIEAAKAAGAKRAVLLPVSVPSHCELMRPAADKLASALQAIDIRFPSIPVVHNADVAQHTDAAAIRQALIEQLYSPVRWVETIRYLESQGVDRVVECGPGRVLSGLNKRISRDLNLESLHDADALSAALGAVTTD